MTQRSLPSASLSRSRARRDQFFAVVCGAVFLIVSILIRPVLSYQRLSLVSENETSLRSLAVNFPRLTLGGFRGLISTWLWIQAEDDKTNRKWVDLETKYDIIASLQPYFVSVYIFHAWNQAYNLSAQWHDQDAKYKWVLDGLAYLYKGEDYNPQNSDLTVEQGNMYFLKLGGSFERIYYRAHWRDDMYRFNELHNADLPKTEKTEALKLVHDIILRVPPENREAYDKAANPLEQQKLRTFYTAELPDPSGRTTFTGFGISIIDPHEKPQDNLFRYRADHKALTEPMSFRYGVSPYYFAYIEFQRANYLANTLHRFSTTTTMRVIGAWPAMSLRLWCRDDLYYGQQGMAALFLAPDGTPKPPPDSQEQITEYNETVQNIQDCYRNVAMMAPKAIDLFHDHLNKPEFTRDHAIHDKHIKETAAYETIGKAENQLFNALLLWNFHGQKATDPQVLAAFTQALTDYQAAIDKTYEWVNFLYPIKVGEPTNPDRLDFEQYAHNLEQRKRGIEELLRTEAPKKPDMTFLDPDRYTVVER